MKIEDFVYELNKGLKLPMFTIDTKIMGDGHHILKWSAEKLSKSGAGATGLADEDEETAEFLKNMEMAKAASVREEQRRQE